MDAFRARGNATGGSLPSQSHQPPPLQPSGELDLRAIHEARLPVTRDDSSALLDLALSAAFVVDWQIEETATPAPA